MLYQSPSATSKGPIWSMEQTDRKWCFLSTGGAAGAGLPHSISTNSLCALPAAEVPGAPPAGLKESIHPGQVGTWGIFILFEGISP